MDLPFIYKYQPTQLTDFELEPELRQLLQTLIRMDSLNILFIGNSGSGKTALINALLQEYYPGITDLRENVLAINSLHEQGIAYHRTEVKTFCQTASRILGKKKIILLDDLDLINEQSQQVFRNCIDKYSHNVHFLASCSNTQKVIDSMQSRLTLLNVNLVPRASLQRIMDRICLAEQITITPAAQEFVLAVSANSVRTVINYLEKFKLLRSTVDLPLATAACTNISFQEFNEYTTLCQTAGHVQSQVPGQTAGQVQSQVQSQAPGQVPGQAPGQLAAAIARLYQIFDRGYSVMDILDTYFLFVKTTPLLSEDAKYAVIPLICKYIAIFHNIHEDKIELALFTNQLVQVLSA